MANDKYAEDTSKKKRIRCVEHTRKKKSEDKGTISVLVFHCSVVILYSLLALPAGITTIQTCVTKSANFVQGVPISCMARTQTGSVVLTKGRVQLLCSNDLIHCINRAMVLIVMTEILDNVHRLILKEK